MLGLPPPVLELPPPLLEDWLSHCSATSAASSLALLMFLPSYQNRALKALP